MARTLVNWPVPQPKGSYLDRLSTELEMLLSGGADGGGSYIMIGRKRG